MQICSSPSAEATRLFARKLSERLQAGDVVWLQGNLGAGKTEFVKGMAEGFGVTDLVTSPTFALLNIYQGRIPLYHFDLYRLADPEELEFMGIRDYFSSDCLCLVEWPEKGEGWLPSPDLEITLHYEHGARRVEIRACSDVGETIVTRLNLS